MGVFTPIKDHFLNTRGRLQLEVDPKSRLFWSIFPENLLPFHFNCKRVGFGFVKAFLLALVEIACCYSSFFACFYTTRNYFVHKEIPSSGHFVNIDLS